VQHRSFPGGVRRPECAGCDREQSGKENSRRPGTRGRSASIRVAHCSAIPCHAILWLDLTLQLLSNFDNVFDGIACTCFWGHARTNELRNSFEVHGLNFEWP